MARTKQTARRSTGGLAPRAFGSSPTTQSVVADIYQNTKTRCIAVEGEVEMQVDPDMSHLSLELRREAKDAGDALDLLLDSLARTREIARTIGLSEDDVITDSVSFHQRKINNDDDESDDEEEEEEEEEKKKGKSKDEYVHQATVVVRIVLEGETVRHFNEVMIQFLANGMKSHSPPVYERSDLNECRAVARKDATQNAIARATAILSGLNDSTIKLGAPLTINDVQIDVSDDASGSFNYCSIFNMTPSKAMGAEEDEKTEERVKRARTDRLQRAIGPLFVAPQLTVAARVQVIFEVVNA